MPHQRHLRILHIKSVRRFQCRLFVHGRVHWQECAAVLQKLHARSVILGQGGGHITVLGLIGCHQLRHAQQKLWHAGGHSIRPQPGQCPLFQYCCATIPQCQHHLQLRITAPHPAQDLPHQGLRLCMKCREHQPLHRLPVRHFLRPHGCRQRMAGTAGRHALQLQTVRHHVGGQCIHLPACAHAQYAGYIVGGDGRGRLRCRKFFRQLFQHRLQAVGQAPPVLCRGIFGMVLIGQLQTGHTHFGIETSHGLRVIACTGLGGQPLGNIGMCQINGTVHIVGQQALVQPLWRIEHRLAAQQHLHELQPRQIAPQHQAAHGQWGGQNQADRPPQSRPERGRHDDGQRRQTGAGAIQPGLDDVVADQLQQQDQAQRPQQHVPARSHCKCQGQRKHGRNHRPHIGHKAHDRCQNTPQKSPGHPDQPQPRRHRNAISDIHNKLHAQVFTNAV